MTRQPLAALGLWLLVAACSAAPTDGGSPDGDLIDGGPRRPKQTDAGPQPDASSSAAAPVYRECATATDCGLPAGLLACQRCLDGSRACPEVRCVFGLCTTLTPVPCPEQRSAATCTGDRDCPRIGCDILCQGDGRSACMPSLCIEGTCVPRYEVCGLLDRCPQGTQAGRQCFECATDGRCTLQVLGCFDSCEAAVDCPGGKLCTAGLCQLSDC